jgi:hypothetical protein
VFASDGATVDLKPLKPETIVLHMVKFFSHEEMLREVRFACRLQIRTTHLFNCQFNYPHSISLNLLRMKRNAEITKWKIDFLNSIFLQNRKGKELIGPFGSGCKRILRIIVISEPKIMKSLQRRRRALDKAVEGMGQHGHVGTAEESLLPLHDALKLDFRRVVDAYKGALQKLEELSLANKNQPKNVSHGPAPIQASHQRQLSLRSAKSSN